jgi:hypothetical protein
MTMFSLVDFIDKDLLALDDFDYERNELNARATAGRPALSR